ncbi:MAG TPA: serine/threonine-protein kinase [Polyangiaceae bacterium]|nr:serine/threonine-protein kinase [Polyangiaceae bacterium]
MEPDLSATLIADRYQVIERIGHGGMGSVYRALHVHMKRMVALKVLHRDLTRQPEAVARFEREAIAAGQIDHPNVAKATDFGRLPDGSCYLVLEYVEGKTLTQWLDQRTVTVEEALSIAKQVCEALSAAHAAGIVHRDLKPDNVMLVERPGDELLVKVLDFGIAKLGTIAEEGSRVPLTRMGSIFGTPEYMAPEQAAGQVVDRRADLYALGVLLYRMLAGHEPFTDTDVSRILMKQVTQAAPALPQALSSEVKELVADLLRKDPNERLQTADEAYARLVYCLLRQATAPRATLLSTVRARAELVQLKGLRRSLGRAYPLIADAGHVLQRITSHLDHGALGKTLRVRGREVRYWQLLCIGLFSFAALGLVISARSKRGSDPTGERTPPPVRTALPVAQQRQETNSAVTSNMVAALEQRPASERSAEDWLALAQGRVALSRYSGAIEAYQEAVLKQPQLAQNPMIAHDTWIATQRPDVADQALRFAARLLGPRGADLLYKVWVDLSKAVTPTTALARELLYSASVKAQASPALLTAMELREARDCDDYARQLPKVMLHGDARCARVLQRVQSQLQCDPLTGRLEAAITALKERPEPSF